MSKALRWGILGTGNIARQFATGVKASRRGTLAAVGSRSSDSARAFAEAHRAGAAFGAYADVVADPDVDAVYVALPNSMHHEWTIRSLAPASTCCARSRWRWMRPRRPRCSTRRSAAAGCWWRRSCTGASTDTGGPGTPATGRHWASAACADEFLLSHHANPGQHPLRSGARRRRHDGHRLLLPELLPAHCRRRADRRAGLCEDARERRRRGDSREPAIRQRNAGELHLRNDRSGGQHGVHLRDGWLHRDSRAVEAAARGATHILRAARRRGWMSASGRPTPRRRAT